LVWEPRTQNKLLPRGEQERETKKEGVEVRIMNYREIQYRDLYVSLGFCGWKKECQVEDEKRRDKLVLIKYGEYCVSPSKCPVCNQVLRVKQFFEAC